MTRKFTPQEISEQIGPVAKSELFRLVDAYTMSDRVVRQVGSSIMIFLPTTNVNLPEGCEMDKFRNIF